MISTPDLSKSATFLVTTVIPWTKAVAAMMAFLSDLGSGTCSLAQRSATAVSRGKIRSENAGNKNRTVYRSTFYLANILIKFSAANRCYAHIYLTQ